MSDETVVQAQTFPDTVTEDKSTVEDRDNGLVPGEKFAVNVDQDFFVPWIDLKCVCTAHEILCILSWVL